MTSKMEPVLTLETMNPQVIEMQYAVRGPIVKKAASIEEDLRKVLALAVCPDLLGDPAFPDDAKDRARRVLASCKGGSVGSYSESPGLLSVRKDVASFIEKRDGHPSNYEHVFLSTGASDAIKTILQLLNKKGKDGTKPGVMIPIPQYPLYSATLVEYDMHKVEYYLDEANHWSLDVNELQRSIDAARSACNPCAIAVINPGNPTGQVLSRQNIESIIEFAHKERLLILADEVYQHNIYDPNSQFHSFKKVLSESPYKSSVQLASFMSTSKGYMGECGLRAGYFEVVNFQEDVLAMLNKCISVKLCPPVTGQTAMECVVNPPKPGEPSYELHEKEKKAVLDGLKAKAELVSKTFDAIDGIDCNKIQGAMYCFPKVHIPERAVKHAESIGHTPDSFYCFELLEKTGLCVVPGSGFLQIKGTHHFRCTILPPMEQFDKVMKMFEQFHTQFLATWK